MSQTPMDRRAFLRTSTLAGGGLMLTLGYVPDAVASALQDAAFPAAEFVPNAFIRIEPSGVITLLSRSPEAGQGMKTTIPMLIAEELEVDLKDVRVELAGGDRAKYGTQFLGGSSATGSNWMEMRRVGAAARLLLTSAAAQTWNVTEAECVAARGRITHTPTGRTLSYGELASRAATLPAPVLASVPLKDASKYRLIGTRVTNVDAPDIVTGKAMFGIDVKIPGMKYAVYVKCPVFGGKVVSANVDVIRAMPGVRHVLIAKGGDDPWGLIDGVAIVADSWWYARNAQAKLTVEWNEGAGATHSSASFAQRAPELAKGAFAVPLLSHGDADGALSSAAKTVEAAYSYPFLYHATLEPMNCTARFADGRMEMWAPTQTPDGTKQMVARTVGIPDSSITVHQVRMGGAFGRRFIQDFAAEAAWIAKACGEPVKLLWSREDDMQHGFYRPAGFHFLRAGLDAKGALIAWRNHFVSFGAGTRPVFDAGMSGNEFPTRFVKNVATGMSLMPLAMPTGPLRAPQGNSMSFVMQSFIDELAHAAGKDPLMFRRELLSQPIAPTPDFNVERIRGVLELVAEKSGWGTRKLPTGTGMGIAFHYSHRGYFAEVVQARVTKDKAVRVEQVWVAGDVGRPIINLSGAEGQVVGAVIEGLGQAMEQEITLAAGRVQQATFRDYPLMRHRTAPPVEVHFRQTEVPPTGLGEPALPPVVPALCNAIFAATGDRVRTLPLSKSGYRWG